MRKKQLGFTTLGSLIFGLVAIGVFLSFRVLDFPDLTVDGSFPLGAAVAEWTSLPSGTEGLFGQGAARAFAAWLTTLLTGFLAMGLLPTMERWFDRVTG